MKSKIPHLLPIVFILTLSQLQSCKKCKCQDPSNPECENYDPCYGEKPVSADFEIGAGTLGGVRYNGVRDTFFLDSIFLNTAINFKALEKGNTKHTWFLGAETITEKEFYRTFFNTPYGKFKVTHIVEKDPNKVCFPNDDGKDTLIREFYTKPFYQFPIVGEYRVLFEGSSDSSSFAVLPYDYRGQSKDLLTKQSTRSFALANADNSGSDTMYWEPSDSYMTGHLIVFSDGGNPTYPTSGSLHYQNQTLVGDYYYHGKHQKFRGRKVK